MFWLPAYHDMGLIGGILTPLYMGGRSVLMSPTAFLQRPMRWLQAIHDYQAIISGAPNFAYEYCVRRTTAEERAALDLSRWRLAFCGAEPIRAETLDAFCRGVRATPVFACRRSIRATDWPRRRCWPPGPTIAQEPRILHRESGGAGRASRGAGVRRAGRDDAAARRLRAAGARSSHRHRAIRRRRASARTAKSARFSFKGRR